LRSEKIGNEGLAELVTRAFWPATEPADRIAGLKPTMADWQEHGIEVITGVRADDPSTYLRVVGNLCRGNSTISSFVGVDAVVQQFIDECSDDSHAALDPGRLRSPILLTCALRLGPLGSHGRAR
jgi:hypothetical protein